MLFHTLRQMTNAKTCGWLRHLLARGPERRHKPRGERRLVLEYLEDRVTPTILFNPRDGLETVHDRGGRKLYDAPVYLIYWGAQWQNDLDLQELQGRITSGVNNMLASSYLTGLRQYDSQMAQGRFGDWTVYTDPDHAPHDRFTQSEVEDVIDSVVGVHPTIPEPDDLPGNPDPIYFVIAPPGLQYTNTNTLGYHTSFDDYDFPFDVDTFYYAMITVPGSTAQQRLDNATSTISHELVEAITDPDGTGIRVDPPPGGRDGDHELCDHEAEDFSSYVNGTLVQSYWSDLDHKFIIPDAPYGNGHVYSVNNFGLTVNGDEFGPNFDDDIELGVSPDGGVSITLNGQQAGFRRGTVTSVDINPGGGNNTITIVNTPANVPVHLNSVSNDTLIMNGGNFRLDGSSFHNVVINGGTLTCTNSIHIDRLISTGGVLVFNASAQVASLTLNGGQLTGTGALTLTGDATWTGGTLSTLGGATVPAGKALTISGPSSKTLAQCSLHNFGTTVWTDAGSLVLGTNAIFDNESGGLFDMQSDSSLTGSGTFFNTAFGIFRKSAGTATTTVGVTFTNQGSLVAHSGTLYLAGTFTNFTSATLTGGSYIVEATLQFVNFTVWTNAAELIMEGPTSQLLNESGQDALANLVRNAVNGAFVIAFGRSFTPVRNFRNDGSVSMEGSGALTLLGITWTNSGQFVWSGTGNINTGEGAVIANSGLWDDLLDNLIINTGGAASLFSNTGRFRKRGGTQTTDIYIAFNNSGDSGYVDVLNGTLSLDGGGSSSGTFTTFGATATLAFGAGTHNLAPGSKVQGTGNVDFPAGTTNIAGTYVVSGTTTISGGVVYFNSPASTVNLALTYGILSGSDTLTVSGVATWTQTNLEGPGATTITSTGSLAITGINSRSLNQRRLNTAGPVTWNGGDIYTSDGAVIANSRLWEVQVDGTIVFTGGAPALFSNTGTFRKSAGTQTTTIAMPFNNSGTVEVQTGTLLLFGGGSSSGSFTAAAAATLDFGAHNLAPNSRVSGTGTVAFTGGMVFIAGTYAVGGTTSISGGVVSFNSPASTVNLALTGGILGGNETLTVSGMATWTQGNMEGPGATTITSTGSLAITGINSRSLNQRRLNTAGPATWNGGDIYTSDGAVIANSGLWEVQVDGTIVFTGGAPALFSNTGTFRKSAGTQTTTILMPFNNSGTVELQTGTLNFTGAYVQSSGSTDISVGAALTAVGGVNIQGGILSGAGTVNGDVTNAGQVNPGRTGATGVLTINGNYIQTATGILNLRIGGPTLGDQFDQLVVNGNTTLLTGSTLRVNLIGGYSPPSGTRFQILVCHGGTVSGTFTNRSLGERFVDPPDYDDPTSVYLQAL